MKASVAMSAACPAAFEQSGAYATLLYANEHMLTRILHCYNGIYSDNEDVYIYRKDFRLLQRTIAWLTKRILQYG